VLSMAATPSEMPKTRSYSPPVFTRPEPVGAKIEPTAGDLSL
jgi:hypothetical protein